MRDEVQFSILSAHFPFSRSPTHFACGVFPANDNGEAHPTASPDFPVPLCEAITSANRSTHSNNGQHSPFSYRIRPLPVRTTFCVLCKAVLCSIEWLFVAAETNDMGDVFGFFTTVVFVAELGCFRYLLGLDMFSILFWLFRRLAVLERAVV